MKKLTSRVVVIVGLVCSLLSLGLVAYTDETDEILKPPTRLASGVPLQDKIQCTECVRGPYIVDTDEEGALPEDLSKLVVSLESAIDEDLDLVITTAYGERNGRLTAPQSAYICVSDSYSGSEKCEFTSEGDLKEIRGRPIYIFVINIGPEDHAFTLTAEWEPARAALCRNEPCLPLVSNQAVVKLIEANGFRFAHEEKQARLFTFSVPSGALTMALRVRASTLQANVDAFIGRGRISPEENPIEKASFALVSSLGEEMIILPKPAAGTYWLAVLNRTDQPQNVEVIATVLMDVQDLQSGSPVSGQIATSAGLLPFLAQYLQTAQGVLMPAQYRVILKEADLKGALALRITLRGAGAPNLHMRFDKVVEISNGRVIADLSAVGPATEKTISLSGTLLKPGTIYLAIEAVGALPQEYELQAHLLKPSAAGVQMIRVSLESVIIQEGDSQP